MTTVNTWDLPEYQRIAAASFHKGKLSVSFQDGSHVNVEGHAVLPAGSSSPDWDQLEVGPYEITVPAEGGVVEIPWSSVRVLTDKAYSNHLAAIADEQARQVGLRIKELREARNFTGKELAERAGISPQSLSRIENGRHDVVFTTLQRILAAMGCSLRDLSVEPRSSTSLSSLMSRLSHVGIDRDLVLKRLLPAYGVVRDRLDGSDEDVLARLAAAVSRVFDWSTSKVLSGENLSLNLATSPVRYKMRGRTNELHAQAYSVYAHFLARCVVLATPDLVTRTLPTDPDEFRDQITAQYGALTFETMLRFVWDAGIAVLPLRDHGTFFGACWSIEGRIVIALKRMTDFQAGWLVDLGHESFHVTHHLSKNRPVILETSEIAALKPESEEEEEATEFANAVLLRNRAHDLAAETIQSARSEQNLKAAVQRIAKAHDVRPDVLANYLAYRLSAENQTNWWPTATSLQMTSPSPWSVARDILLSRLALGRLPADDRNLLLAALDGAISR